MHGVTTLSLPQQNRWQYLMSGLWSSGKRPGHQWISKIKPFTYSVCRSLWWKYPHHGWYQATLGTPLDRLGRRCSQSTLSSQWRANSANPLHLLEPENTSFHRSRCLWHMAGCTPLSWNSCLVIVCCPENWLSCRERPSYGRLNT